MFVMYDSVDLSQVPRGPHAVACYRNGKFANEAEAHHLFPHARILPISVTGWVACDAYDVEAGDYTPADVPRLWHIAHSHGIWRPCFYANESTMPEVEKELQGVSVPRAFWRKWQAHWDAHTSFDGDEDAKQFDNRAIGRNLDESICRDTFFPPLPPPRDLTKVAQVAFDTVTGHWHVTPEPDEHVIRF